MTDVARKPEQNSPKTSPRGSRSPAYPRQDSTGTLKTTITLGRNPAIIHSGPFSFYLMKEPPDDSEVIGSTNLMAYHGLEHSYNKFSGKKLKEELSAFLPNLPGNIDTPAIQDNSSLRMLLDKQLMTRQELMPLSTPALTGFRLHPGPLPEQYRLMTQVVPKRKHKHKKHKRDASKELLQENQGESRIKAENSTSDSGHDPHKKVKKAKRSDEEKEKKKRKKEKKKKKEKEKEEKTPTS